MLLMRSAPIPTSFDSGCNDSRQRRVAVAYILAQQVERRIFVAEGMLCTYYRILVWCYFSTQILLNSWIWTPYKHSQSWGWRFIPILHFLTCSIVLYPTAYLVKWAYWTLHQAHHLSLAWVVNNPPWWCKKLKNVSSMFAKARKFRGSTSFGLSWKAPGM